MKHPWLKEILILVVVTFTFIFTPQLTLAATTNKTRTSTKEFNVKEAFNLHSSVLRALMLDLYECQPQALQKSTKVSKEEFVQWVFEGPFGWKFDAIKNTQSIEALAISFSKAYQGDRVLPLITGLHTMILQAYGGKNEYTFEVPNPKKLSIAAHNIDIATAKLLMENQENNHFDVNKACRIKVRQALNEIAKQVNADASKIDSSSQISKSVNPLEMDANTLEFIPF